MKTAIKELKDKVEEVAQTVGQKKNKQKKNHTDKKTEKIRKSNIQGNLGNPISK